MAIISYDSHALQQYRDRAAELAKFRQSVEQKIGQVEIAEAQKVFDELTLRTKELEDYRLTLNPKDLFMAKYNVTVVNEQTVSFVIPRGTPRIDILEEAQRLVGNDSLIEPGTLQEWRADDRFTTHMARTELVCIDGCVEGLNDLEREHQEVALKSRGLSMATFEDLSVAFAAFWVATNEPLFGWFYIARPRTESRFARATGGTLDYYEHRGLCKSSMDELSWWGSCAAARLLPSQDKSEVPGR